MFSVYVFGLTPGVTGDGVLLSLVQEVIEIIITNAMAEKRIGFILMVLASPKTNIPGYYFTQGSHVLYII
jgi:hypothetical protein